jgi:hypothetical protein
MAKALRSNGQRSGRCKMKDVDIAYLAGIIDADGCIGIQKYSNCNSYRVILTVVQRDVALIEYLFNTFSGSINVVKGGVKNAKFYLRWVVTDTKAMEVLVQCIPYLKLKKQQAYFAKELFDLKKLGTHDAEKMREIYLKNKSLNSPATTERVDSKEMQQSELTQMRNRQRENRSVLSA